MTTAAFVLILTPALLFVYAYAGYPALLWLTRRLVRERPTALVIEWPTVTLTIPVYNEERNIRSKLDDVLEFDYPADKLQVLVISDASTDATDEIVEEYADRGVELLRLPERRGKSAAENAAGPLARGSIIVNSDATVRVPPHALRELVAAFSDPTVGVASGRDVSIGAQAREANGSESSYVGYEMWVRRLETQVSSIVGASGCFYGIRASIYASSFPEELSRDFASALMARQAGLRAVSVEDAICYVPRVGSLQSEFRRKIRTMARGLETLWQWRRMLNPFKYGAFALMLLSHKLCRWLVYLSLPFAALGLALLAPGSPPIAALLAVGSIATVLGWVALRRTGPISRPSALLGFVVASTLAGVLAWVKLLRRQQSPMWEPTRRVA